MEHITSLLQSLDDALVCPFDIEEAPQDLSPLPCGHIVSLSAWRMYELKNPGRICRCPECNQLVEKVGRPLPMGKIGDIVRRVREECQELHDLLEWNEHVPAKPAKLPQLRVQTSDEVLAPVASGKGKAVDISGSHWNDGNSLASTSYNGMLSPSSSMLSPWAEEETVLDSSTVWQDDPWADHAQD